MILFQILFKVLSPSYKLAHNHDLLSLLFVIVSSCHCLAKFYDGKITRHSPPQLIEKLYFSRNGRIYQNHLGNYPLKFMFLAQSPTQLYIQNISIWEIFIFKSVFLIKIIWVGNTDSKQKNLGTLWLYLLFNPRELDTKQCSLTNRALSPCSSTDHTYWYNLGHG